MASAGVISVDVQAKIDNFVKNLNTCTQKAESFSNNLSAKLGDRDYFAPMRESIQGMGKDMRQIAGGIIFAQTFYKTVSAVQAATAAVWEYTDALNYAQTTFSNLFRSTELAEEFVAVLQEYAARSPFDFTDVEDAAMQLRSYGIEAENLMFIMQGIGNLASVTGDYTVTFERVSRAIGQISAKGKLMGEEMRQLAEAGLDVSMVYERLGTSAQTVADDNIDAATAINAIVDVLNENYAGALDTANTTVRGMVGNIKDLMLMISSSIAQPAYDMLRGTLYKIYNEFNEFQQYFQAGGLRYAIEQYFGPDVLNRVEQFISSCVQLGTIIYSVLVPALRIAGSFSTAFATILSALLTIIAPVVSFLAKLTDQLTRTAAGTRILETAMLALASAFVMGKIATVGMMVVQMLQKVIAGTVAVVQSATAAQMVYNANLAVGATVAQAAAASFRAFTAALKVNPIIVVISVILALISALVGLRSILGGISDTSAAMSDFDASKWLDSVKTSTGDISKFNNRLENTNDQLSDMQDNLTDTGKAAEKAVEGLLSFDEVFSLPEANDSTTSSSSLDTGDTDLGDLDDFDVPLPDLPTWEATVGDDWFKDLVDWFKDLDWNQLAGAITAGILSALENLKNQGVKLARKIAGLLPEKSIDTIVENIKDNFVKAVKQGNASAAYGILDDFSKNVLKVSSGAQKLLPSAVEEISESATKSIKKLPAKIADNLSSTVSKIADKVAGALSTGVDTIAPLVSKSTKTLANDVVKLINTPMNELPGKIESRCANVGTKIADKAASVIAKGVDTIPSLVSKSTKTLANDVVKLFTTPMNDIPEKIASRFAGMENKITSAISSKMPNLSTKIASFFSEGITGIPSKIDSAVSGIADKIAASIGVIATETPSKVSSKFASLSNELATVIASKLTGLPREVVASFDLTIKDLPSTIAAVLSQRLTGANILAALKDFGKTLGLSIIGDWLFDMIEQGLRDVGQAGAAGVLDSLSNELSVGIATLIVSKNPFAALGAIVCQHIFDSIDDSMQTGDWTGTITQITDGILLVLSKAVKGLGKGGPILAIASIASDLIFGGISNALEENGDTEAADITTKVGNTVSAGLTGAGIGAMIGSVVPGIGTAIGGAIGGAIGLLIGGLVSFWDEITGWWDGTFVPGWNDFWSFSWATADDSWLQTTVVQPITQQLNDWNTAFTDWKDNTFIPGWNYFWSFQWVTDGAAVLYSIFLQPIVDIFTNWWTNDVSNFWENTVKPGWDDFWSFGWLTDAANNVNEQALQPAVDSVTNWWNDSVSPFWEDTVKPGWDDFWSFNWLTDAANNINNQALQPAVNSVTDWWNSNISPFWDNTIVPGWNNMWDGLGTAGSNIWNGISSWMDTINPDISSKFSGAATWLWSAGQNIMSGLGDGLNNYYNWVFNIVSGIPDMIKNCFSNAGDLLYNAGVWIVQGLIDGLANNFHAVTDMVSDWGAAIASVKGPEAYDKKLLIPNGQWITGGLLTGLESLFPDVLNTMSNLGPQMEEAFSAPTLSTAQFASAAVIPQSVAAVQQPQTQATIGSTFMQSSDAATQQTQDTRPIVYVQNMIANKQGIRELKKQLDIVDAESDRWK